MKKIVLILLITLLLGGCYGGNDGFGRAMALRTSLVNGEGCAFDATITADFGDKTYTFCLSCESDAQGNIDFTVRSPQSIEGICGTIRADGGALQFDGNALSFPLQSEELLSPVSAPWVLVRALRSGYVRSCAQEDGLFRMRVDDSFRSDALTLDIWVDSESGPVRSDIYEENRRIVSMSVENFRIK